jgi:hypothetical protein
MLPENLVQRVAAIQVTAQESSYAAMGYRLSGNARRRILATVEMLRYRRSRRRLNNPERLKESKATVSGKASHTVLILFDTVSSLPDCFYSSEPVPDF